MGKEMHNQEDAIIQIPESGNFEVETGSLPCDYSKHFISVGAFDSPYCEKPVTMTAGTAVVTVTDDGYQWGNIQHGTIDLKDPAYPRPNLCGRVTSVKIKVKGILPVSEHGNPEFFRLRVHSYK